MSFEKVNPSHPDKVADRIAGAIVDNCCRQIRKICDEAIYAKNDEVIEKVAKIRKIVGNIHEQPELLETQNVD